MTYAVIDITFLVAGAAHRAMKLYSKPSLASPGDGEGGPSCASSYRLGRGKERIPGLHQGGRLSVIQKPCPILPAGRGLDNNEEALNTFQKIALKHGFSETDIYILKHDCE